MGANAVTTVYDFTAGQVLTAAQMDNVNCGIPVFATTTTRDAAFGGTGEKTLAEGQMAYIENIAGSSAVQYYDGSAWQTLVVGGLTLVKTQTIGSAVSSVTVSDCFSSTYDNYKILISNGVGSTDGIQLNMALGASTTQYYTSGMYTDFSTGGAGTANSSNSASWIRVGYSATNVLFMDMDIIGPNLAYATYAASHMNRNGNNLGNLVYLHNVSTAYTSFTLTTSTGTLTGGTIRVYGYANS